MSKNYIGTTVAFEDNSGVVLALGQQFFSAPPDQCGVVVGFEDNPRIVFVCTNHLPCKTHKLCRAVLPDGERCDMTDSSPIHWNMTDSLLHEYYTPFE